MTKQSVGVEAQDQPSEETANVSCLEHLRDSEKLAIDRFISSRYKLSAFGTSLVVLVLGFLLQDYVPRVALDEAKRQAWEFTKELEGELLTYRNSHISNMAAVESYFENVKRSQEELQDLIRNLDLKKAARVLQDSADDFLKPPHFTQFDSLAQGDTDLGEHTLCFLMTVEIDASKAQTCQVTQRGARWVATVDSMTCQVGCLDLM